MSLEGMVNRNEINGLHDNGNIVVLLRLILKKEFVRDFWFIKCNVQKMYRNYLRHVV